MNPFRATARTNIGGPLPPSPFRALPVVVSVAALVAPGAGLGAQIAEVSQEEYVRAEPDGTVLGRVEVGSRLPVVREEGDWAQVRLAGWVWTRSLQIRDEGAFDLVVSEPGGENLREEPQERILARLETGTLLEEVERIPGWVRVNREAWVWGPALSMDEEVAGEAEVDEPEEEGPALPAVEEEAPEPEDEGPVVEEGDWTRVEGSRVPLLLQPDGDTLGRAEPDAQLQVLEQEGNWARVRMEGWIWLPDLAHQGPGEGDDGAVLQGVTAEEIAEDPEGFQGRMVELPLQFISLERAEPVRTDFYEGEPFLLTRSMEGARLFVYVAVPSERAEELEALSPLEEIRVLARVRTGEAALTGSPILDLLELRARP